MNQEDCIVDNKSAERVFIKQHNQINNTIKASQMRFSQTQKNSPFSEDHRNTNATVNSIGAAYSGQGFALTQAASPLKQYLNNTSLSRGVQPISMPGAHHVQTSESVISLKNMKPMLQTVSQSEKSNQNVKMNNIVNVMLPTNDTATNINFQTQRSLQREGTSATNYMDFNQSLKKGYSTLLMQEDPNIINGDEDLISRPYQSILECFQQDPTKTAMHLIHKQQARTNFRNYQQKSPQTAGVTTHGIRETLLEPSKYGMKELLQKQPDIFYKEQFKPRINKLKNKKSDVVFSQKIEDNESAHIFGSKMFNRKMAAAPLQQHPGEILQLKKNNVNTGLSKDDSIYQTKRVTRQHFNSFFPSGDYRERKFKSQWTERKSELCEDFKTLCVARHEEAASKNKLQIVAVMMCCNKKGEHEYQQNKYQNQRSAITCIPGEIETRDLHKEPNKRSPTQKIDAQYRRNASQILNDTSYLQPFSKEELEFMLSQKVHKALCRQQLTSDQVLKQRSASSKLEIFSSTLAAISGYQNFEVSPISTAKKIIQKIQDSTQVKNLIQKDLPIINEEGYMQQTVREVVNDDIYVASSSRAAFPEAIQRKRHFAQSTYLGSQVFSQHYSSVSPMGRFASTLQIDRFDDPMPQVKEARTQRKMNPNHPNIKSQIVLN